MTLELVLSGTVLSLINHRHAIRHTFQFDVLRNDDKFHAEITNYLIIHSNSQSRHYFAISIASTHTHFLVIPQTETITITMHLMLKSATFVSM